MIVLGVAKVGETAGARTLTSLERLSKGVSSFTGLQTFLHLECRLPRLKIHVLFPGKTARVRAGPKVEANTTW